MELSEIEKMLVDEMKERGLENDSIVGIMLFLEREAKYEEMNKWLKKNSNANEEDIYGQLNYLMGK